MFVFFAVILYGIYNKLDYKSSYQAVAANGNITLLDNQTNDIYYNDYSEEKWHKIGSDGKDVEAKFLPK